MKDPSETTFGMTTDFYMAPTGSFNFNETVTDYLQQRMGHMFKISASKPESYQYKDLIVSMDPSNTLEILGVILREKIQERTILLEQLDKL